MSLNSVAQVTTAHSKWRRAHFGSVSFTMLLFSELQQQQQQHATDVPEFRQCGPRSPSYFRANAVVVTARKSNVKEKKSHSFVSFLFFF